jgi:hypothetical protein
MFAIWWTAWNTRDPATFPLPAYMTNITSLSSLPLGNFLFGRYGKESWKGVILREAWEGLDSNMRDLMMYCWCCKVGGISFRNTIAHPVTYKKQAEEILANDLCDNLTYLRSYALTSVSNAPDIFK